MICLPALFMVLPGGAPKRFGGWGTISLRTKGHLQYTSSFHDYHYSRLSAMMCLRSGSKDVRTVSQSPVLLPTRRRENTAPHKTGQAEHAYILFPSNKEMSISKAIPLTSGPALPWPLSLDYCSVHQGGGEHG